MEKISEEEKKFRHELLEKLLEANKDYILRRAAGIDCTKDDDEELFDVEEE